MTELLLLFVVSAFAADASAEDSEVVNLGAVRVFGGSAEDLVLPVSPQRVTKEKIESYQYTDVNRALKQAPGVYVREEDGQGLRPNIGLRGTNPDRSKKIVLMEDGVLIGPAPYAAPAAYYTPNMNHVGELEVFKGFAAIPYGPNSIGGALNYLSTPIPVDGLSGKTSVQYGSHDTSNVKVQAGAGGEKYGALVQASRHKSDGFKKIDGGGDAGFLRHDYAVQGKFIAWEKAGAFTVRLGFADEDSHETYLGLTQGDLNAKPYRRYAASANDRMRWSHQKVQLENELSVGSAGVLRTTLYRHQFHRAWYRLESFRNSNSETLRGILKNPTGNNLAFYQVITGQADTSSLGTSGELKVLNNDRRYVSQGIQTRYLNSLEHGNVRHDLEATLRWHGDRIRRNHTYDLYEMTSGRLARTGSATQIETKNEEKANAKTLSFQDNINWKSWVFTAAGRAEQVNFAKGDILNSTNDKKWDDTVFVPGAGALYQWNSSFSTRASVNRAVTVAGLDGGGGASREESTNYELGAKFYSDRTETLVDVTGFWNAYRNITGTCTASTGCSASQLDQQFNGGRARVIGVESRVAQGFRVKEVWVPVQLNATWLRAEFMNDFNSPSGEWGVGFVRKGDPLPYVPQIQYTFSVGAEYKRFKQEFAFVYQGKVYDQSLAVDREEIPAYGIVDWSSSLRLHKNFELFAKVDNLLAKEYTVSFRPFGYRSGKPRAFMAGITGNL